MNPVGAFLTLFILVARAFPTYHATSDTVLSNFNEISPADGSISNE